MARTPSRRLRRMMKQMGLKMDTLTDVEEVVIRGRDREIVIEEPIVAVLDMKGERVYQITGGHVKERRLERKSIPEEDILLVAQRQASASKRLGGPWRRRRGTSPRRY